MIAKAPKIRKQALILLRPLLTTAENWSGSLCLQPFYIVRTSKSFEIQISASLGELQRGQMGAVRQSPFRWPARVRIPTKFGHASTWPFLSITMMSIKTRNLHFRSKIFTRRCPKWNLLSIYYRVTRSMGIFDWTTLVAISVIKNRPFKVTQSMSIFFWSPNRAHILWWTEGEARYSSFANVPNSWAPA